jgi:hypothetical protein
MLGAPPLARPQAVIVCTRAPLPSRALPSQEAEDLSVPRAVPFCEFELLQA